MNELEKMIVEIINEKQGIKATELVVEALIRYRHQVNAETLITTISSLVEKGEIIEIEYNLPTMAWRTKSFLLPKDAIVRVVGGPKHSVTATTCDGDYLLGA